MSIKHSLMTWKFPLIKGINKLVALAIADIADEDGECFPSEKHLAKYCGISERSVRSAVKFLSDGGYMKVTRRFDSSNLYRIIPIPKNFGIGVRKKKT